MLFAVGLCGFGCGFGPVSDISSVIQNIILFKIDSFTVTVTRTPASDPVCRRREILGRDAPATLLGEHTPLRSSSSNPAWQCCCI